jgi:hypothetical protein
VATDRDEQQREQQRQQQELEEIRRSFAEMGARMGSMFDPPEPDEAERSRPPLLPPAPPVATSSPFGSPARPRRWWVAALGLLFVAGTLFGYILPRGDGGSGSPSSSGAPPATSQAPATTTRPKPAPQPEVSVPDTCVEAAELADEVISRLTRNIRDNRLAEMLRDYTIASQACRREASP